MTKEVDRSDSTAKPCDSCKYVISNNGYLCYEIKNNKILPAISFCKHNPNIKDHYTPENEENEIKLYDLWVKIKGEWKYYGCVDPPDLMRV